MLLIPVQVSSTAYKLFVFLEQPNIDRIRAYDPASIEPAKLGAAWAGLRCDMIVIGYAIASEILALQKAASHNDTPALMTVLRRLGRGFQFLPNAGDSDDPYQSLKPPTPPGP